MNASASAVPYGGSVAGWSLTRTDMLLCFVPIALFMSIMSLV